MMLNFLLFILLTISDGTYGNDPTKKASLGEFNYFVMVWYRDEFRCSGTIIDQRHIIARGTCVMNIPSSNLSIIAGSNDIITSVTERLQVESVHIHYGFKAVSRRGIPDGIYWVHDIAVLKLVNRMIWDSLRAPAVLITEEYDWNEDLKFVVPGWRPTHIGTPMQRFYIRWNKASSYTDETCIKSGVLLLENEKCCLLRVCSSSGIVHYSGSPVVHGNTVIGIVDGRKREKYHAFLSLLPYKDFIDHVIDDRKNDASPQDAKYVVSIWNRGNFKCGGIILNAFHILTTGNCVKYADSNDLQVIAGYTQVLYNDPLIRRLSISNIEGHPGYDEIIHPHGPKSMTIKNNNAILTLAVPLEWGSTIGPITFSTEYFICTNPVCRAFRWHYAYTVNDEVLLQLVWSQVFIVSTEVCRKEGVDVEADEICVSQPAEHFKSLDSSGNPVVCENCAIAMIIPDFSTIPRSSCFTSVLSLAPLMNSLDNMCYGQPT